MYKKFDLLVVALFAVITTSLFHRQSLGLNLMVSELLIMSWLYLSKQFRFKGFNMITLTLGLVISSVMTVLTYSVFAYILNFLTLFLFVGVLIYQDSKSLISSLGLAFLNIFNSQILFLKKCMSSKIKGHEVGNFFWKSRIFLIPLIIILIFVFIYRKSNPVFDAMMAKIDASFNHFFSTIFVNFDALIIVTFIISLILSIFIFLRTSNSYIVHSDVIASDQLLRNKKKVRRNFRLTALKNEYKAGVFLLLILNALLFIVNVIDVNWVWFNFEWEGQYLKQFVHEGTYLLILSILISIALVLYFFRGNINFFTNNKLLKVLSIAWLAQNAILTISVGLRNFYYISYFSLAYKRIGVVIFLLLVLYGLFSVYRKVQNNKSTFYLFRTNIYAMYIILLVCSFVNWDIIIAKYNFTHADRSFLHLNYMATLSDKTLPILDKPLEELKLIDKNQKEKFPFDYRRYMTPEKYAEIIKNKKARFIQKWENKNVLSWNLPEYLAYKKLKATTILESK